MKIGNRDTNLSRQVRAARGLLEWTQADLANNAKVTLAAVGALERAQCDRDTDNAQVIVQTLEKQGIQFLNGIELGVILKLRKTKQSKLD